MSSLGALLKKPHSEADEGMYHTETGAQQDVRTSSALPSIVKKLYGAFNGVLGMMEWHAALPSHMQPPVDTSGHAIVLRYVQNTESDAKHLRLHSLLIRGSYLGGILERLFKFYPGQRIHVLQPTFEPPFHPFYHQWAFLQREASKTDCLKAPQGTQLDALISALGDELGSEIADTKALAQKGQTTFYSLWTLFPPGCPVLIGTGTSQHCALVDDVTYSRSREGIVFFRLTLWHLDHDGNCFRWSASRGSLEDFEGTRVIADLDIIPVQHLPAGDQAVRASCNRGSKVCHLLKSKIAYREHAGLTINGYMQGRIIIDARSHAEYNQSASSMATHPGTLKILIPNDTDREGDEDAWSFTQNLDNHVVLGCGPVKLNDLQVDVATGSSLLQHHRWTEGQIRIKPEAFSWNSFGIENVSDIKWNANAFDALVMPPARKRLLEALVKQQEAHKTDPIMDDVVAGKGQGLILLLPGPPGTGKTLTAESVADRLHIPLYTVSASELGDDVKEIEEKFGRVLKLAGTWNSVLLLDEADAFLERRVESPEATDRNKRVAGHSHPDHQPYDRFRRSFPLPHPPGAAIQSSGRGRAEESLVDLVAGIGGDAIEELAKVELNGRQIKNVSKMAKLLAKEEGQDLQAKHVHDVMEIVISGQEL